MVTRVVFVCNATHLKVLFEELANARDAHLAMDCWCMHWKTLLSSASTLATKKLSLIILIRQPTSLFKRMQYVMVVTYVKFFSFSIEIEHYPINWTLCTRENPNAVNNVFVFASIFLCLSIMLKLKLSKTPACTQFKLLNHTMENCASILHSAAHKQCNTRHSVFRFQDQLFSIFLLALSLCLYFSFISFNILFVCSR